MVWKPGHQPASKGKGKALLWVKSHVAHADDACLEWPYSRDRHGYGNASFGDGKVRRAHRLMCTLAHGEPPSATHVAAHSCHNRGCCNPRHLSWKTNAENQLDRRENGTAKTAPFGKGGHVLTPQQIAEARILDATMTRTSIAQKFGCSRRTIERACR